MSDEPLIELKGITKTFGTGPAAFQALKGVDMTIDRGDFVAVMGPSGSGKSSLLLGVAGLLPGPFGVEGRVMVGGEDVLGLPVERRGLGLMLQDALLYPHMSVLANVLFAVPRSS